ncbi:MAG: SPOR domain-containing protein, partial [Curvibacter sp.]
MAWFKFGKQDAPIGSEAPVETVEVLRTRAKRRLVGALVLVMTAVVGFPLLFDTQPRSTMVDVPIEIPDKNKVKPLVVAPSSPASAAKVDAPASLGSKEEIVPSTPSANTATDAKAPLPVANTSQAGSKT